MTNSAPRGTQNPTSGIPQEIPKAKGWGFNPFQIFKQQSAIQKLGRRGHERLTWEKKELPGAGAGQYAWETLGLPIYPVFGRGNINVQAPLNETFPGTYMFQAVGIVGIPPQGILQGQFTTQPLIDPNAAQAIGIVAPGSIPIGPNAIINGAPVLGP
jgi:hypothetical protein